MKDNKLYRRIFYFIAIVGIGVMIIAQLVVRQSEVNSSYRQNKVEITEYKETQINDDKREYIIDANQFREDGNTLAFYTAHQQVQVCADGEELLSATAKQTPFGRTTGGRWNFVEIPEEANSVTVELTAVYASNRADAVTFYSGDGVWIYAQLMDNSQLSAFISLFNLILGLCMVLYWIVANMKMDVDKSLLYMGLFAILIGLWSFGETDMAVLLLKNRPAMSFIAFTLLMMMQIPFGLFIKEYQEMGKDPVWKVFFLGSLLNFIICMSLQLLQIKDLKETAFITHGVLIISFLYMCYALGVSIRKHKITNRVRVNIIGMVIIAISMISDLIAYYMRWSEVDSIGRFGFLAYIVLLGGETAAEMLNHLEAGLKADFYRKKATSDELTGMYNRNAFDHDVENNTYLDDLMVFIFDLNNLKKCNDTLGHTAGDTYIRDAADIIIRSFPPTGKCYRIGGDEFAFLINNPTGKSMNECIDKMRKLEIEYNQKSPEVVINIACGYALKSKVEHSFQELKDRADHNMYLNKEALKRKQISNV